MQDSQIEEVEALSQAMQDDIKKIYLGKSKSFADGTKVNPVNQNGTAVADEFNDKLVGLKVP